jgi:2-amino-4-hydroxy-6-hydroxymethyldihydropteridine diphosphokinase
MPECWIALGANLGDREASLKSAVRAMSRFSQVVQMSSLYETEPVGFASQPPFLNAVAKIVTGLDAQALLGQLLGIEQTLGRERTVPNGPRIIDLDLLFYGDLTVHEPGLEVPHPRLHQRRFVLAPLAEIEPALLHPLLKQTVAELLAQLPAGEWVRQRPS